MWIRAEHEMRTLRRSEERGHAKLDWLDSRHTFSFGDYYDPAHMGFRTLRVINEDHIAPASGFGPHPHRDMEILTYPIEGALEHRDSEGHRSVLRPGRVQLMRAGRGIVHSEMNPLPDRTTHLLQIWIESERRGLAPDYQEIDLDLGEGDHVVLASRGGREGGLDIRQDASVCAVRLGAGGEHVRPLAPGRHAWVQIVSGDGRVADLEVGAGDGVAVSALPELRLSAHSGLEALVFDLA